MGSCHQAEVEPASKMKTVGLSCEKEMSVFWEHPSGGSPRTCCPLPISASAVAPPVVGSPGLGNAIGS